MENQRQLTMEVGSFPNAWAVRESKALRT